MTIIAIRMTFAVALVLILTATGLWAAGGSDSDDSAAAAEKEMVRDPSTGQMILKPQYGGSIAEAWPSEPPHTDTWWGSGSREIVTLFLEVMGIGDWALDRDVFDFKSSSVPLSVVKPPIAESFEISPDGLTFTFNIRPGVYWHDKAPDERA